MRLLHSAESVATQETVESISLSVANLERANIAIAGHDPLTSLRRLKYAVTDLSMLATEVTVDKQWLVAAASEHVCSASDLVRRNRWTAACEHLDDALAALLTLK
jgi:hypothetical protein